MRKVYDVQVQLSSLIKSVYHLSESFKKYSNSKKKVKKKVYIEKSNTVY